MDLGAGWGIEEQSVITGDKLDGNASLLRRIIDFAPSTKLAQTVI